MSQGRDSAGPMGQILVGMAAGFVTCFFSYTLLRIVTSDLLGVSRYPGAPTFWICGAAPIAVGALVGTACALAFRKIRVAAVSFAMTYAVFAALLATMTYAYYT